MKLPITLIAVAVAAAWSTAPAWSQQEDPMPPAATAQGQEPGNPDQGAPVQETTPRTPSAQIDDKKLDQFADAYVAVQSIQQKAAADLQNAKDPQQAQEVKSNAENQMIAAVERTGLKVDEFNQIVETMASNNDVRSRVAAKLQERAPAPN